MARKDFLTLIAQANSSFPDNTTGLITPAALRNFCIDFLNAIMPAYGYLTLPGPTTQTLGTVSSLVVFSTAYSSDSSQIVAAVPASTIARSERGTVTMDLTFDVEAANGRLITFTVHKNGTPTTWRQTAIGQGAAKPVSVSLTAMDYADPAATYSVQAVAEIDGVSTTLSNAAFIVGIDPVRSYT